jgi:hypothetical protein
MVDILPAVPHFPEYACEGADCPLSSVKDLSHNIAKQLSGGPTMVTLVQMEADMSVSVRSDSGTEGPQ